MNARNASTGSEDALDVLARALAPRVAKLLREQATAKDADAALSELLASAGFELDSEGAAR